LRSWLKALAGLGIGPYRRWGLSPRPENIGRPGLAGLTRTMAKAGQAGKRLHQQEPAGSHAGRAALRI
jgi:hypothetical protein